MNSILFFVKKLVAGLLMPIPVSLMAMVMAFVLFENSPKIARFLLLFAILLLGLTSWSPIANRMIAQVEGQHSIFDISQSVAVVIVLGSSHRTNQNEPAFMRLGVSSAYRLEEGLRILRANPNALLFLSGFAAGAVESNADVMRQAALDQGVDPKKIRTFPLARDTEEEASMMAPYLRGKKAALVSDASHLKRALLLFQSQGVEVFPAPSSHLTNDSDYWNLNASMSYKAERAIYEWMGRVWQWLKG